MGSEYQFIVNSFIYSRLYNGLTAIPSPDGKIVIIASRVPSKISVSAAGIETFRYRLARLVCANFLIMKQVAYFRLFMSLSLDSTFDAYVAIPLAEFAKSHSSRERIWISEKDKRIVGSIAIVKHSDIEAQLRWLLLDPQVRGQGLGRRLLREALDFCRDAGYSFVFLWTVDTLPIATKLYQSVGFKKTQEVTHEMWGSVVTEVRYDLALK